MTRRPEKMSATAAPLALAAALGACTQIPADPARDVPFGETPGIWASELPGNGEPGDDMQ